MNARLAAVVVLVCALSASAGTITSISPSSIKVNSGEQFMTIYGSSLGNPVVFDGPAGVFTLNVNAVRPGAVDVWIPLEVVARSGLYSVSAGNSNKVTFTVNGFKTFPLTIIAPEFVWAQPRSREGVDVNYEIQVTGGEDPFPVWDCSPKSGSFFRWGTTQVYCAASNRYDEKATAKFDVNVSDRVAPIVKVPDSIFVKPESNEGAYVKFEASAYDEIWGELPVSCYPASESLFPIGTTIVNCTAIDPDKNEGVGLFTVEVEGDVKPLILKVPDTIYVTANDPKGEYVRYEVYVENSDDPEPRITCTPESGSLFPVGTNAVTCSALDRFGARGEGEFMVEVIDPEAPVIKELYSKPDVLTPADGRLYDVEVVVEAYDTIDPAPQCAVFAITSNQDIDLGDDESTKEFDWTVTGPLSVQLRAEFYKVTRYYDIWVGCTDYYGNATNSRTRVAVPADGQGFSTTIPTAPTKKRSSRP